jgi:hypothetical protein
MQRFSPHQDSHKNFQQLSLDISSYLTFIAGYFDHHKHTITASLNEQTDNGNKN